MKNHFIYKLAYPMHRIGFYFYSVKFDIEDYLESGKRSFFSTIKRVVLALIDKSKIFRKDSGYYEYIEIPITTKCTRNCKSCSNLIPYYGSMSYDVDTSILHRSIDVLTNCISNIVYVRILGGEPFLSSNLVKTLDQLIKCKKIQRIEIVTNGTIIPENAQMIRLLSNRRVVISISKYPNVQLDALTLFLSKYHIRYHINEIKNWVEYGKPQKQNKSVKELKKQYRDCRHICKSLLNGKLHLCPRSSHGMDLKLIEDVKEDYVDLLNQNQTIEEKKVAIAQLFQKEFITACDYCLFATRKCKKISVAEQMN